MSEESLGKFEETWSVCVHDLALNRTELCVSNFWATSERRLMSQFTAEIYQTSFDLVTFAEESTSWASTMAAQFRPFHFLVWVDILFLPVAVSGVEHTHQSGDLQFKEHQDNLHHCALEAFYFCVNGFVSGSSAFQPNTLASKFFNLFLDCFILILSAAYTANMASFLVISAEKGQVSTIPEGLSAGMTPVATALCTLVSPAASRPSTAPSECPVTCSIRALLQIRYRHPKLIPCNEALR
eukprot:2732108-Rhodomonas_salina.1